MLSLPHSGSGNAEEGGNPTDFLLVMGPLKTANETAGVMEIFQRPGSSPTVQRGYLRFLLQMCELASEYLKIAQAAALHRPPGAVGAAGKLHAAGSQGARYRGPRPTRSPTKAAG